MNNKVKLGRPTGPSEERVKRPWDPIYLKPRVLKALLYVLANPGKERCVIAQCLGMSGSKLSTITCSELGQEYLQSHQNTPESQLKPYKI